MCMKTGRRRCQVSGIRCKVSGARCQEGGHGVRREKKTTFQAGMCMKTGRRRCQVSGIRCKVSGARCQEGGHGVRREKKTTFQAGMCMKTKRRRCQVSGTRCKVSGRGPRSSTRKENDVPSRNVYENKEKKVSGVRYQVQGVRKGATEFDAKRKRRSKPECV